MRPKAMVGDVMMMIHALFLSLSGDWGTASSYGITRVEPLMRGRARARANRTP